jgi:hypothetical protein
VAKSFADCHVFERRRHRLVAVAGDVLRHWIAARERVASL